MERAAPNHSAALYPVTSEALRLALSFTMKRIERGGMVRKEERVAANKRENLSSKGDQLPQNLRATGALINVKVCSTNVKLEK